MLITTTSILIVIGFINLVLGLGVFLSKTKFNITNTMFALIAITIAIWTFVIAFFRHTTDYDLALLALKQLYFFPVFIPLGFLFFVHNHTKMRLSLLGKASMRTFLAVSTIAIATLALFSDIFVADVIIPTTGEKQIIFGSWYILYIVYFTLMFGWSFLLLLWQYLTEENHALRIQTLFLFLGTFISSSIGLMTNLIFPWLGFFALNWFGNVTTVFFVGFIFYAIVRHKLFDLKLISTEILTFGLWFVMLSQFFMAKTPTEQALDLLILVLAIVLGTLIIKSVYNEVGNRERIETLAQDLEHANKRLRAIDKQKSDFVSIAAHQLRGPLTAINGYSSLLLEDSYGKIPDEPRTAIEKILYSGRLMASSIDDFLNVSRIERGKIKYDFAPEDLAELLKRATDEMAFVAKEKGLAFNVSIPDGPCMVTMDRGKIKQVLTNLIDNSIKYTPKGSIDVKLAFNVRDMRARISIEDTGIGVRKKDQKKLFDKFTRAGNANNSSVQGTGIGLYVAREFILAHKGHIWVESEGVNKGSKFFIELDLIMDE